MSLIFASISKEMALAGQSEHECLVASYRLGERLQEWRLHLPLLLGFVPPSYLVPSHRRQARVIQLAHAHAVMQLNRSFILGQSTSQHQELADNCVNAAKSVFEIVDEMARSEPSFHAFWWTHYVMFCALAVTYAHGIQQRRSRLAPDKGQIELLKLAETCYVHLAHATAANSPSRRYADILAEYRFSVITQQPLRPRLVAPNIHPKAMQLLDGCSDES